MASQVSDAGGESSELRLPFRKAFVVWTLGSLVGWMIVFLVASMVLGF